LRTYELESFLKSFVIFFLLLELLLLIDAWHTYGVKKIELKEKVRSEMQLCAYMIQCEGMQTDFVDQGKNREENILYKEGDFYGYFKVPDAPRYLMKVVYPQTRYVRELEEIRSDLIRKFLLYTFFAALVSLLFSIYALMPLQRALHLNEEFVKDILHDFNTPLGSMKINLKIFKKEIGDDPKIARIENNMETILSLQHNLQAFLKGALSQIETLDIRSLIEERLGYFRTLYPNIIYRNALPSFKVSLNKDAFVRIVDNLLSNAGKYNRADGEVVVRLEDRTLVIEDTGKGIARPSKVFDRYYKEQERGVGIGLHIVKKLCDEMHIAIKITSKKGVGTKVLLDLAKVAA